MRIITWNVNSVRVRQDHIKDLLHRYRPSLLALQETKVVDSLHPNFGCDYKHVVNGQKMNNGVTLISKRNGLDCHHNPLNCCEEARVLAATYGSIRFVNLYIPNGAKNPEAFLSKLIWLEELVDYLEAERAEYKHMVVLGDFNICPTDNDIHDPEDWLESVSCTSAERELFQRMLDLGFIDVMADSEQEFTCWDYRKDSFSQDRGMRLDHILVSTSLAKYVKRTDVLRDYRSLQRPSDHAPVMVDIKR